MWIRFLVKTKKSLTIEEEITFGLTESTKNNMQVLCARKTKPNLKLALFMIKMLCFIFDLHSFHIILLKVVVCVVVSRIKGAE